jgi:hypothetical protein
MPYLLRSSRVLEGGFSVLHTEAPEEEWGGGRVRLFPLPLPLFCSSSPRGKETRSPSPWAASAAMPASAVTGTRDPLWALLKSDVPIPAEGQRRLGRAHPSDLRGMVWHT